MPTIEDLITDIGSIVTSVRPREIMTLKRIEEDYRAIYSNPIPFYDYGFSSLSELLEHFPEHFKFSMADGMLIVRTNFRNNVTDLIAKERKSKKPKNFCVNPTNAALFKKHRRREMKVEAFLPSVMLKSFAEIAEQWHGSVHKSRLLVKFKDHTGYECKFQDYGFLDENELLEYLNGNVLLIRNNMVQRMTSQEPSIFVHLKRLLTIKTGYSLGCLQEQLSEIASSDIPSLMKAQGHVNFVDVIYDGHSHGLLTYDHDLVYSASERVQPVISAYPAGLCHIKVVRVISPSDFNIEIISNQNLPTRQYIHEEMQRLAPNEPLLAMFKDNRFCSLEYDGEWYRGRVGELSYSKTSQSVRVYFVDFPIELKNGIEVSLPTDRLRYVPQKFEGVSVFIHKASLAYVSAEGGREWSPKSCESFNHLVTDLECVYQSYLADQSDDSVSLDITAWNIYGEKISIFQRMVEMGLAQSLLNTM